MSRFSILICLLCAVNFAYAKQFTPSASFRIFPSGVTQTEPVIAINPANPSILFVSAYTINTNTGFLSEGVYVTTDGGITWTGSDTCKGTLLANHGGDPGVMITPDNTLILTHIGSVFSGVYSHYSTNMGGTWSGAYTITSQQPEDKGTTTGDLSVTSPYYQRIYSSWVNYVAPYPVLVSFSTNSGISWSSPSTINNSPPARCSGGSIKTGRDGTVYVCWAGVADISPFTENYVGFAASSDGGVMWHVQQNIFDMNGISGTLPSKGNIRVNGLPQLEIDNSNSSTAGTLYIVTNEKNLVPAGSDPDIILHRSTDNGAHWSAGIRVNQDSVNNNKIQYFPAMTIDSTGGINIIFYDDRNTSSDSAEVMLARSTNGGDTWKEYVISDHRCKPKPIFGGSSNYQGDHIAIGSAGGKLFAIWMDDYSGIYQVWMSIMGLSLLGVSEENIHTPRETELYQNYPNPFNPTTVIEYDLVRNENVRLRIYDASGKEVATLAQGVQSAGHHTLRFESSMLSLSSGLYFYELKTPRQSRIKKMLLLR